MTNYSSCINKAGKDPVQQLVLNKLKSKFRCLGCICISPEQLLILKLAKLVSNFGSINSIINHNGESMVFSALDNQRFDIIDNLLQMGLDLNDEFWCKVSNTNITPIQKYVSENNIMVVRYLLSCKVNAGIYKKIEDEKGKSSLFKRINYTPLIIAAMENNSEMIELLLQYENINISITINGKNAFFTCIKNNNHFGADLVKKYGGLLGSIECPICFLFFEKKETTSTKCNHTFCSKCLNKWVKKNSTKSCPVCRRKRCM